jgi:hypothetical protein
MENLKLRIEYGLQGVVAFLVLYHGADALGFRIW